MAVLNFRLSTPFPYVTTVLADEFGTWTSEGNFDSIPIIDLAPMKSPELAARQKLAGEIRGACMNVGFFYIKNHGVDASLVQEIHLQAKQFFSLPTNTKMKTSAAIPLYFVDTPRFSVNIPNYLIASEILSRAAHAEPRSPEDLCAGPGPG
ncbi:hypothetical protein BJX65DRAFT_314860 [Aspergillus insuetus]